MGHPPRWLGGWNTSHQGGDGALFVQPAQRKFNGGYSAVIRPQGKFLLDMPSKKNTVLNGNKRNFYGNF